MTAEEHQGPYPRNGDRFRQRVLSRGSTKDLAKSHSTRCGRAADIDMMKEDRGLVAKP